ncbi:MAG TPA: hypothetical protein VNW06_12025 [Cytophagaceae bacterium]|nr:hypothetical protein [Cytophagaceae bacterium]
MKQRLIVLLINQISRCMHSIAYKDAAIAIKGNNNHETPLNLKSWYTMSTAVRMITIVIINQVSIL